jgi:hypothetical protein
MERYYTDPKTPTIDRLSVATEGETATVEYGVGDEGSGLSEVGIYLHDDRRVVAFRRATLSGSAAEGTLAVPVGSADNYRFYVEDRANNREYERGSLSP